MEFVKICAQQSRHVVKIFQQNYQRRKKETKWKKLTKYNQSILRTDTDPLKIKNYIYKIIQKLFNYR